MRLFDARNPLARRYGCLLVLIPLLLLISSPIWLWSLTPTARGRALVVDKTVEAGNFREHESLYWVLHHSKVKVGEYLGPHYRGQQLSATPHLTPADLEGVSWLLLADTYGIYKQKGDKERDLDKIDGGLDDQEISAIEQFLARGGHLYGEFNTLAFPTVGAQRSRLERLFGLSFTGWTGRYFQDLADSTEVPDWMHRWLKKTTGQDWIFTGPGYVILNEDGRLIVLAEDQDVPSGALTILRPTPVFPLAHSSAETPFSYWFDIMQPRGASRVLASYELAVTARGRERLTRVGLKSEFPAVISLAVRGEGGISQRLYCCGDFSDNPVARGPYWLRGWPSYARWRSQEHPDLAKRFFWSFYLPLMQDLFLAPDTDR